MSPVFGPQLILGVNRDKSGLKSQAFIDKIRGAILTLINWETLLPSR